MSRFASTNTLKEMLERGEYKRLVMENDEEALNFFHPEKSNEAFETALTSYQEHTAQPSNYDYLVRRQVKAEE